MAEETTRTIQLQPLTESKQLVDQLVKELVSLCETMEIDIDLACAKTCVQHLLLVNQVNQYMNLTRIKDIHEALVLHVVDSLALTRDLPIEPERFLDMGTGAGFPGIPFAVYTGCEGILLDSVGKKVNAVNAFIDELGISNAHAVHERCESYALNEAASFDVVFARAVGQMNLIVEYGAPFLEDDGYLIVAKANPSHDEKRLAERTAEICGLELVGVDEFDLPRDLGHRTVFLYQKVMEPRVKLPRPVGLAKKQSLV